MLLVPLVKTLDRMLCEAMMKLLARTFHAAAFGWPGVNGLYGTPARRN